MNGSVSDSPLGKSQCYEEDYNPKLLFPIPRKEGRDALGLTGSDLPFEGTDIWNAYEVSWLDVRGKPYVAICEIRVPCESPNIVESKSLKLYFGSFNQTTFESREDVSDTISADVAKTVGIEIDVKLVPLNYFELASSVGMSGVCIDDLNVEIKHYEVHSDILKLKEGADDNCDGGETLYSHLLRSNCPVTGQPDWATVMVRYKGKAISHESLLQYIVSYRQHSGFHELCVERIFMDILLRCKPEQLTVYARYSRRGGIDINPFRSNFESTPTNVRLPRQ